MFDVIFDWLIWVSIPASLVVWMQALYPVWRLLPPYVLILLAVLLLAGISRILIVLLPDESPQMLLIYRGIQAGLGLVLAIWRVLL
jgi:hypothetical protein